MVLPQKLKYLRKQMGLSQLELAEKLRVSRQAVSGWEAGTSKPSTESLKSLGSLYNVSLEYLLNEGASEPDHVGLRPSKEETINVTKKKNRSSALVLIAAGFAIAVLCVMSFWNKDEEMIPMGKIEGSDMVIVDDFEMDW